MDSLKYKTLKIRYEIPKQLENKLIDSNKLINSNNNYTGIKDYDDRLLIEESDNKYKNSYSNNCSLKVSKSNLNNSHSEQNICLKKESNKTLIVLDNNNKNIEKLSQYDEKEYKSMIFNNKANQLNDKEIEKSLYSSRASSKNEFVHSGRKTLASGKQSPDRNKNVIDKLIEGFEKNKNLTDRELNNELKNQDLSKSSINQFNNKINQILKRNPSLDEKQFNIIKSSDLKVKIDSIRNEIQDSLIKDKESSLSKKNLSEVAKNQEKTSISLTKNKKMDNNSNQTQTQKLKNNSLDSRFNN